jgi:hypothetical protein
MWYTLGTVKERGTNMTDITTMSDEELSEISKKVKEEIERREYVEREKDWEEVCDALRKYLNKWEKICVMDNTDKVTLHKDWIDLSEFDVIRVFDY